MGRESLTDEVTDQESGVKVKDESIDGRGEREKKRERILEEMGNNEQDG